jgi:hypothetical protein
MRGLPARTDSNGSVVGARKRAVATQPTLRLGTMAVNGISASMYGLVERGADRRPKIARALRGEVELRFDEDFAPVRMRFTPGEIVVEDVTGGGGEPDLVISGSLPHIVQLAAAPLFGGVPKPTTARGRKALAQMARGSVKIEGSPLLARRLLKLLEI